ncbi:hypothetical protein GOV14_06205 [Candidatus Pacearchaeota archaeon]|nr:hypothetical protein [Candidatus Pacearchaeota archaeon]
MSHKSYNSAEYKGQRFIDHVIDTTNLSKRFKERLAQSDSMYQTYGWSVLNTKQSGDSVYFDLFGVNCHVTFESKKKKNYAVLEKKLGAGGWEAEKWFAFKIERSKTKRINESKTFSDLFEQMVKDIATYRSSKL